MIKVIYSGFWVCVFLYTCDFLIGWLLWLRGAAVRAGLAVGLKAAANLGLGNDGPQIAIKTVEERPRGGDVVIVTFPPGLEEKIVATASEAANHTTRQFYQALAKGQMGLFGTVTQVLSDVTLVHAQYYQHPLVISLIADCIAGRLAAPNDRHESGIVN